MAVTNGVLTILKALDPLANPPVYLFTLDNSVQGSSGGGSMACVITTPAVSAVLSEGSVVTISGTISRPATSVAVSLVVGGALGSATVDNTALTWTYSWTPGDTVLGARTISVLATALTGGTTSTATVSVSVNVPLSRFSAGGYWDLRTLSGADGDVQTATIASAVGSNVLTPINSPTIDDTAIGGSRSLILNGTNQQLRCDALAARVNRGNTWGVIIRGRQTLSTYNPLFCAGNSGGSANYFQAIHLPGTQSIQLITNSPGSGAVARVGTTDMHFDEHRIYVTSDGTNLKAYIDGNTEALDLGTMDPNPISCDRFAFGGVLSSVASQWFTGPISLCAFSNTYFTALEVAQLDAQIVATDFLVPLASRKKVAFGGDSITAISLNTLLGSGRREYLLQWFADMGLSLRCQGQYAAGSQPENRNVAQGGNNMDTIRQHFVDVVASDSTFAPDVVSLMQGTNDMAGGSTASQLAGFRASVNGIAAAVAPRNAACKYIFHTIPPMRNTVTPGTTNIPLFNAGLLAAGTGEFDVFATANPGKLVARPDSYAALGSAWSLTDWDSYPVTGTPDTTHPNEFGCQKMGAAEVAAAGLFYRSLSTTIVPLSVRIIAPAAGSSAAYGSPVTISGRVSRYPSTVVVKKDGVTLGSATVSKKSWTYTWNPVSGDLGAHTFTAVVTDTLDSTTATSAGSALTVTAPVGDPLSIFTTFPPYLWWRADTITNTGGTATALTDKTANGHNAGVFTAGFPVTASDATLSGQQTLAGNAGTGMFANPVAISGTYTLLCVVKLSSWTNTNVIFGDLSGHGITEQLLTPNIAMNNGSAQNASPATFGTWVRIRAIFKGGTLDSLKVGSAAPVTGASSGTTGLTSIGINLAGGAGAGGIQFYEAVAMLGEATSGEFAAYDTYLTGKSASIQV